MNIKKTYPIIQFMIFAILIVMFILRQFWNSKYISLAGEVISISKHEQGRSKGFEFEVMEKNQIKYLKCDLLDTLNIQIGDSVFRDPNSHIFVKSKLDGVIRPLNAQHFDIY